MQCGPAPSAGLTKKLISCPRRMTMIGAFGGLKVVTRLGWEIICTRPPSLPQGGRPSRAHAARLPG
jgi:hypothetical protein